MEEMEMEDGGWRMEDGGRRWSWIGAAARLGLDDAIAARGATQRGSGAQATGWDGCEWGELGGG